MKKFLFIAALLISGICLGAATRPVSREILASFNTDFKGNQNAQWTYLSESGLYQVNFTYQQENLNAFYDESGQMIAIIREIGEDRLPMAVLFEVKRKYPGDSITRVLESTLQGETKYFVTVSNAQGSILLQSTVSGDISIFKKSGNR
ncbi:hypothetical protein [Flavihumibacter petaseus]|uniref:Beta-lactamase-inhibitor-like PepSY-like domain-containing protein n=1 Tax=Flavihumibacter petaseus NBRC 106054 TaxID=1220578 RepID=A0A0E9MXV2_9BACT|nr:hypothetical protein [Flavihumibacter petaseus]GAO42547.1 hypothetical protein FPE01S_01_15620 [Flavihumibacter petaseus NBRC 106054]